MECKIKKDCKTCVHATWLSGSHVYCNMVLGRHETDDKWCAFYKPLPEPPKKEEGLVMGSIKELCKKMYYTTIFSKNASLKARLTCIKALWTIRKK